MALGESHACLPVVRRWQGTPWLLNGSGLRGGLPHISRCSRASFLVLFCGVVLLGVPYHITTLLAVSSSSRFLFQLPSAAQQVLCPLNATFPPASFQLRLVLRGR